ncbi:RsmB/NOP family class I SAM-dependent RNA methyltransferase [Rhizobium sp. NLR22b]|uniref:RsmB/NOP family class I SAM-dependent RNA methyltransferase n=1 Tax=Rhizobium sp. NLR22b TaxID=2731115 RepID=UPI001C83480E|nr:RsmB/NOP family class I SAM-dependent RNA methyltransferase [Rhizobium sp. NLR22b]MBX5238526.1 MFS transporter [Rhizobium sp. NLR22b]
MVLNSDGTKKPFRQQKPFAGRSAPAKPGLQTRAAAAKILAAVVDRKLPLDGALDHEHGNPAYKALGESDRALVRAILNTTLRHLPRIDAAIASLLESPLPEGARALHHVLAIAAAQILYLDVPDHSAVDLAVEQANLDPRNRRFAKLVNAVLRRLGREKDEVLEKIGKVPPMPGWFLARLEKAYGRDAALAIAQSQLEPAAIDLTVKSDAEAWAKKLNGVALPTGGVRLAAFDGGIPSLEGFDDGAWWVQDAAASIPARLFGDLSGKRAADLCAAPGGKTAQLILAGGAVTALDQSESRLRRLRSNLDRLGLNAETVATDLTTFKPTEGFDAILLDAPCSSTGTTRRHPDVLWTKGPDDIARLAALQERLLRHALTLLKPGGTLVFSNCSLDPAEGEEVVARVVSNTDAIERVPISAGDWPGLEAAITPLGEFRTLPTMLKMPDGIASGLDGFYAVMLRRAA